MAVTANGVAAGERRILSTPYARRLARERGLALSVLVGSGPRGRITGADVLASKPPTIAPQPAAPLAPAASALAASVDLAASRDLLAQFADLAPSIGLIDIILKSAAASLKATRASDGQSIGLANGGVVRVLPGIERLTLGAIAALRGEAAGAEGAAALTISWIERDGISPVATTLDPGVAARLVIAAGPTSTHAQCLLSYDPQRIDDSVAADILVAFKGALEIPLRLIA